MTVPPRGIPAARRGRFAGSAENPPGLQAGEAAAGCPGRDRRPAPG